MPHVTDIDPLIDAYLASDDPRLAEARARVRRDRFLPLYLGWLGAVGLRSNGTFIVWLHDDLGADTLIEPAPAYLARLGIMMAIPTYPQLVALIPVRPQIAVDCSSCSGTGRLPPPWICECGGTGWFIPNEDRGPVIG